MEQTTNFFQKGVMFTFKRWGRKSYSLFSVLRKAVRIGVLLGVYTTSFDHEYALAQTDTTKVSMKYDLDEVEVNAQKAPVVFSQVARIVSVISREEIEAAPVQSIQELLEYALSTDVRQRGAFGVQADISVRGGSFDQTLILLNGVNISDPQTGHYSLDLPVSLKNIQRIEILEGPAARVFGPNAFSGVINIITSAEGQTNLKFDISAGQHKLSDLNLSGNLSNKSWTQFIAFNRIASDGYIDNTDFKTFNAFYQLKAELKPGTINFQLGRTDKDYGANSFYSATYPNQYEKTKTTFASVKFETGINFHISPTLYWRRHQDTFELFRDNPPSWYTGYNYHLTDVFGSKLDGWFSWKSGKTAFGAEIRSENIWSNVLGNDLTTPIEVPGESGQYFTKSYSRTTISYFAEHSVYLKNLSISAGVMANHISDLGFGWKIYPGADVSYEFINHFKLYGSANSTLRMPTFTDLFYTGPTNTGNPDLKPEKSTTVEGGIKFSSRGIDGHADVYYRKGKNLIDWVRENDSGKWKTQNLTSINTTGFEFCTNIFPERIWKKHVIVTKFGVNYAYSQLEKGTNDLLSYYVLDNLKHKLDVNLEHKIWKNLRGSWRITYQDRNGQRTQTESYQPIWQVNTRISWKTRVTEIYAMASNLFDKKYYDLSTIEQPGRWISFGFCHQINFK
jgi:vitamin B12 transporter